MQAEGLMVAYKFLQMKSMLCEALLRRAHDDDYSVVRAVLSVRSFIEAPFPDRLFKLLESIITKCLKAIHTGLFSFTCASYDVL